MPFDIHKVHAGEISDRIAREAPKDAKWVFDCDGTLIHGDIASLTAWTLIRMGLVHPELLPKEWDEFKKLPFDYSAFRRLRKVIIEQKGMDAIYQWEAFLHAGLPPKTSLEMATLAVKEGLNSGSMQFTGPCSDLAKRFKDSAWIVSGSPNVCVWAVGAEVGIPPERILGTQLETVDGIFAPRIVPPGIIWEDLKRQVLVEHGIPKPYFVAGDSIGDWQMFQISHGWCWAVIWGIHRHRGEEMGEKIQRDILGVNGPKLPTQPGCYFYEQLDKKWVFEIRGAG